MDHFLSSSSTGIITSDAFVSRCTLVVLSIEVSLLSELRLRLISRHNNLEPVHNTREARTLLLFDFGLIMSRTFDYHCYRQHSVSNCFVTS